MKRWTPVAVLFAFLVGLAAPAYADNLKTSAWGILQQNPGTNCTILRAVINQTTDNAGSTVRSKATCSESASDVNLPADRMGVYAEAWADPFGACGSSGGWVYNSASTAVKSVTATVLCSNKDVFTTGWGTRKINSTDWVDGYMVTDTLYFP